MTEERKNEIWAMLPEDYKEFAQTFHRQWKGNTAFINECCVIEALFGSHNLVAKAEEKPKESTVAKKCNS